MALLCNLDRNQANVEMRAESRRIKVYVTAKFLGTEGFSAHREGALIDRRQALHISYNTSGFETA